MIFIDDKIVDIACPSCHRNHPQTIGWLKKNQVIHCPCGKSMCIDASIFKQENKTADKVIDNLVETLGKSDK